jgi:hypothetical protein
MRVVITTRIWQVARTGAKACSPEPAEAGARGMSRSRQETGSAIVAGRL